ncbi:GNAT family N-acetyltransferase [Phytomonospora endophytica]|uniref:ElaA protein n=1 Tax=Phytomonospora endophytica TaxID=714109 RepID=A0A841FNZ3_9ACTN|nr:GNAT family N-acetyltransferase [Phytomonospora endophytica]MBB6034947.1 ElaA protein [Phytomonospora endophytica]
MTSIRAARFTELDTLTLYTLLRLRVDVFVVEQKAAYPELDGRDTEPSTVHIWTEGDAGVTGYLRILSDAGDVARIGRVCTALTARGSGVGGLLMEAAMEAVAGRESVLDAQTYAKDFYARFGYRVDGDEYLDEDGIPHVPMRRAAVH